MKRLVRKSKHDQAVMKVNDEMYPNNKRMNYQFIGVLLFSLVVAVFIVVKVIQWVF